MPNERTAPMTDSLRGLVDRWHDTRAFDHGALAQLIRDDGIDILVDLQGHLSDNRLPVFAMKPAPVQVSWLGYPGTTGLQAIDRLSEALGAPEPKRRKTPAAQPATPAAEPPAAEEPPAPSAPPDKASARQALMGYVQRHGKEKGLQLLAEFGVSAFSDLKPEQYAELVAKCDG